MPRLRRATRLSAALLLAAAVPLTLPAQQRTSPKQFFGHDIGADYELPNYTKLHQYWIKVAQESDRVSLDTIGLTEEGRPQIMAIVTSPANHRNLARYKEIATKLGKAEGLDSAAAAALAREGKVVFWIDGGLHATEVLGAQQLIETLWQLSSRTDTETMRILDDVVILMTHANPDGMELVSDWYMKEPDKLRRTSGTIPRLYEKYAGHDNNRDSYMNALAETRNMSQQLFIEWHPQIMYNHHQTGPTGTVMAAPPYRDPANFWFHPAMITGLDLVGAALNHRFVLEHKPGLTFRQGSNYSTWWNGGLRTTGYYHNQIGILTETIGNPTPMRIALVPERQVRSAGLPMPIEPQEWHFRQSVDYSVSANYAFLDLASRYRETFLFNRWVMGNDQIKAGQKDNWTISPKWVAAMTDQIVKDRGGNGGEQGRAGGPRGGGAANPGSAVANDRYMAMLKKPENRDPRAYILSSAQNDFPTASKFVRALQYSGIDVHRATASFSANGKQFPAGSWVIHTSQAFRAHVLDMFEPQDHPNDFRYPGGPPIPPYDNAGWTLAYQMGVQFERVLDGLTGPFEKVNGISAIPAGTVAKGKAGYFIHAQVNDGNTVANRLQKAGVKASRIPTEFKDGSTTWPAGSWFIPAGGAADKVVAQASKDLGVNFAAANAKPSAVQTVQPLRIGLIDRYGGNMPSGWTRLILEKFEFPYTNVFPEEIDKGNLKAKYDVLVFTDGMFSEAGAGRGFGGSPDTTLIPAEYRRQLGRVSSETSVPQIKQFIEAGGRVVAIGSSIGLGKAMGLPIENHLTEANGRPLPGEKYYIPGSVLEVALDTSTTIAAGMDPRPAVMFDNSPVMKFGADASAKGLKALATFDNTTPLRSGWAWGQELLKGGVAMAEANMGKGTIWLFGPEILFRSQPHGTYKLFLNALDGGFKRPQRAM
ncbi:MAG: peptidase [Gemmatimonadaceae bacterium]|nr:peptidase [Gemmatimonadaceae bacterium]